MRRSRRVIQSCEGPITVGIYVIVSCSYHCSCRKPIASCRIESRGQARRLHKAGSNAYQRM